MEKDELARRDRAKELVSGLYGEWYGPLVRYAFRTCRSLEGAEDAVQTAFVELYRALLEGKSVENPKGWTLCVVRREVVDRFREQKRHGGPFADLSEVDGMAIATDGGDLVERDSADLTRLLSVLSRREEEVLLLRAQAMKYRQIAAELEIGINSVKTLLARAIRKMRQATAPAPAGATGTKRDGDNFSATLQ